MESIKFPFDVTDDYKTLERQATVLACYVKLKNGFEDYDIKQAPMYLDVTLENSEYAFIKAHIKVTNKYLKDVSEFDRSDFCMEDDPDDTIIDYTEFFGHTERSLEDGLINLMMQVKEEVEKFPEENCDGLVEITIKIKEIKEQ